MRFTDTLGSAASIIDTRGRLNPVRSATSCCEIRWLRRVSRTAFASACLISDERSEKPERRCGS